MKSGSIEILLVEDNPGDVVLTQKAFERNRIRNRIVAVETGEEAMNYLHRHPPYEDAAPPDIILLDLNLPGRSGREVLKEIKSHPHLRAIPVVVLTSSDADTDVQASYESYANSYITKPISAEAFLRVARTIEDFWFDIVKLPSPD